MPTTPDTSFAAAPPTSDPDASSAAQATESTTTSTTRWSRALTPVNLDNLSVRSQAIRIEIGEMMPDGYRLNEIASELGVTTSWVSQRLDELRSEIALAGGGFLPLTDSEYAALKDSIAEHGQQIPVIVGTSGVIDGKHRITILRELGINEVLVQFVTDADPETERRIGRTVNAARRHLNRAQKEALVRSELEHNWERSSRQIALDCGTSIGFIETVRETIRAERAAMSDEPPLEAPSDPEQLETLNALSPRPHSPGEAIKGIPPPPARDQEQRVDARGVRRPAYVRQPGRSLEPGEVRGRNHGQRAGTKRPHGYAECCHGTRHAIWHDSASPGAWRLEPDDG